MLFAICVSSLVKCQFKFVGLLKNCGVCFLSFKSSLYIVNRAHFYFILLLSLSGLSLFFYSEDLSLFSALKSFTISLSPLYFPLLKSPRR